MSNVEVINVADEHFGIDPLTSHKIFTRHSLLNRKGITMNSSLDIAAQYNQLNHESTQIKQCLNHLLPPKLKNGSTVCVAGSAPLQWLLLNLSSEGTPHACLFKPNDIDIFVYGDDGRTEKAFREAVLTMIHHLKDKGYYIEQCKDRVNLYIYKDTPVMIVDIKIRNLNTKLSFVQCPRDSCREDLLCRFDIDVVRVIYDIAKHTLVVNKNIQNNIEAGEATVKNFSFGLSAPNNRELHMITQTLRRMSKYASRGFRFNNIPQLLHSQADVTRTLPAKKLPRWNDSVLRNVLKVIEKVIPLSALKSGEVGLFGTLPLMKILNTYKSSLGGRIPSPWKVDYANICICGADAKFYTTFYDRVKLIVKEMRQLSYTLECFGDYVIVDGLGVHLDTILMEINDIELDLHFIRCPHVQTCKAMAETSKLGIEKAWYDFNTHSCQSSNCVREQIQHHTMEVDNLTIRGKAPTNEEVVEIHSVLSRMQYYGARGFSFYSYPNIISCCPAMAA